jgi:hypothetical protein
MSGAIGGAITGEGMEKVAETLGASEDVQAIVNLAGNLVGDGLFSNVPSLFKGSKSNRIKHVQNLLDEFGITKDRFNRPDDPSSLLMQDFLETRGQKLNTYVEDKLDVIDRFKDLGEVPVQTATDFLDTELANVTRRDTKTANKLAGIITSWREAIQNKPFDVLEATRADLFDELKSADNADIRDKGTQILNRAYGKVVEDMGEFLAKNGSEADVNQWRVANRNLSDMAKEFNVTDLETLIKNGNLNFDDVKVEDITRRLTSMDESDIRKVYNRLSPEGQELAKTAIIAKIADEASTAEGLDPTQFANKIYEYSKGVQIAFDPEEQRRIKGLMDYLVYTRGIAEGAATGGEAAKAYAINKINPVAGFFTYVGRALNLNNFAKTYGNPQIQNLLEEMAGVDSGTSDFAELVKRLNRVVASQQANQPGSEEFTQRVPETSVFTNAPINRTPKE